MGNVDISHVFVMLMRSSMIYQVNEIANNDLRGDWPVLSTVRYKHVAMSKSMIVVFHRQWQDLSGRFYFAS